LAQSGDQVANSSTSHFYRRIAARCDGLPVGFDVVLPDGSVKHLGAESCDFRVVLHNKRALRALGSLNEVSVAEAYFSGDLDIDGDIFRALSMREVLVDRDFALTIWRSIQPWLFGQSKLNKHTIASHYDHDPEFFSLFLDPEMPIYTQGVFENDDESLATAAKRKFDYCFAKLRLRPGDHVLEVGPGWGAWLKYASERGVKSTAISISHASLEYLRGMTGPNGYDWNLVLADILEFTSRVKFDAIVMMGIIEHLPAYRQLLAKVASLLKPGGREQPRLVIGYHKAYLSRESRFACVGQIPWRARENAFAS
jgi:cyclopropane-fatty-acyl-phospholipid synthase